MRTKSSGTFTLYLSLVIAMGLSIIPWSNTVTSMMPNWALLALMYWSIALPHKVSVGTAWVLGLLVDTLSGSLLGQNALIFSLAAFFAHKLYLRLRNYRIWQQALFILFFLLLIQLISLWISQLSGAGNSSYQYWYQPLSSAIAWPVIFLLLRLVRRRFNVQ